MMWFSVWGFAAMFRRILLCIVILALSACAENGVYSPVPVVAGIEAVSIINTKKTVDDHFVSWITGDDCSTVRASRGEPYCEAVPKPGPVVQRTAYCYKTLAAVSCYDQPIATDTARFYGTRTDDVPFVKP